MRDHVKFRILNASTLNGHVHHQHAHQWLHTPNSDNSHYLDSQMLNSGSTYTLEMVYNGSGNRNQTVGDSIFHCHFYPHFAQGMWSLWRVHDVFEEGTALSAAGIPVPKARALPDGEISSGTPIPAIVPLPTIAMAPFPAKAYVNTVAETIVPGVTVGPGRTVKVEPEVDGTYKNPGYPFFIPGVAGHRPPHPPLDFAWQEDEHGEPLRHTSGPFKGQVKYLDGGLPRHSVLDGNVVREKHTRWDFTKDYILYDSDDLSKPTCSAQITTDCRTAIAGELTALLYPEDGTKIEKVAMKTHATRSHASFLPDGDPGNFILNGLPPVPGAPYAAPSVSDDGNSVINTRTYKSAVIQTDVVLNKQGWHFPQQRYSTLWEDVAPTVAGDRAPQPFFFRAETGESIEFWHTNLVPDYYELDDFQVRTPTDILGQHIHLVKFDVTSSDGAVNGFNYEDGTLAPNEVRSRIDAITRSGGLWRKRPNGVAEQIPLAVVPFKEAYVYAKGPKKGTSIFGPTPPSNQTWDGAQTTIQRWDTDPLLNNEGKDRTLRTVFTHDHFGPSTHQQVGLYAGLLVEPEGSRWSDASTGRPLYDTATRVDGGPTSWQAIIKTANVEDSHREFAFLFQDFQLAYTRESRGTPANPSRYDVNNNPTPTPHFAVNLSPTITPSPSISVVPQKPSGIPYQPSIDATAFRAAMDAGTLPAVLKDTLAANGMTPKPNAKPVGQQGQPPQWEWSLEVNGLGGEAFQVTVGLHASNVTITGVDLNKLLLRANQAAVPAFLKSDFLTNGVQLSPAAKITAATTQSTWMVQDGSANYQVVNGANSASIHLGTAMQPTTTGSGPVPQPLASEFARKGITLSAEATIQPAVDPDCAWLKADNYQINEPKPVPGKPVNNTDIGELYCVEFVGASAPNQMNVYTPNTVPGWVDAQYAIQPPVLGNAAPLAPRPGPGLVSSLPQPGTYSVNYRNEPLSLRLMDCKANPATCKAFSQCDGDPVAPDAKATDPSSAFASIGRTNPNMSCQPAKGKPINSSTPAFAFPPALVPDGVPSGPTDPFTPMLRAYEGDKVQIRTLVGAHYTSQSFWTPGVKWRFEPSDPNSGYRNAQGMGLSEHFEFEFDLLPTANTDVPWADYLYVASSATPALVNGTWGIMRAFKEPQEKLMALPNNPPKNVPSADPTLFQISAGYARLHNGLDWFTSAGPVCSAL